MNIIFDMLKHYLCKCGFLRIHFIFSFFFILFFFISAFASTPRPSVKTNPTETINSTPQPSVKTNPTETIRSTPRPSVKTNPTETIRSTPQPSVKTNPTETIRRTPRPSVETNPTETIRRTPRPSVETNPTKTIRRTTRRPSRTKPRSDEDIFDEDEAEGQCVKLSYSLHIICVCILICEIISIIDRLRMRYKTRKNSIEVTDKSNQRRIRKAKLLFRAHRFFKNKKRKCTLPTKSEMEMNRLQAYSSDSDDHDYDSIFDRST